MHLNDEQLLELSDEFKEHVDQCESCAERLNNLQAIRKSFREKEVRMPASGSWVRLREAYIAEHHNHQLSKANKTTYFWKVTSGTIAASFLVGLVINSYLSMQPQKLDEQSLTTQISALIAENNSMQEQLLEVSNSDKSASYKVVSLMIELEVIDKKLQQAYLLKKSDSEKHTLWSQRQQVIESTLTAIKQPQTLKI